MIKQILVLATFMYIMFGYCRELTSLCVGYLLNFQAIGVTNLISHYSTKIEGVKREVKLSAEKIIIVPMDYTNDKGAELLLNFKK